MRLKNRLKKIVVGACVVVVILCSSIIQVLADETSGGESGEASLTSDEDLNVGVSFDGKVIPYLPDEVYGKNYVIVYQSLQNFTLYIVPDNTNVYAKNANSDSDTYTGSGTVVMTFSFPENTMTSSYIYNITTGWSEPTVLSSTEFTLTPGNLFIERSTLDIYNLDDNSIVFFEANADIIEKSDYKIVLSSFGEMLSGFLGCTVDCAIGVFCFTCIVATGIIGIIMHMAKVRY